MLQLIPFSPCFSLFLSVSMSQNLKMLQNASKCFKFSKNVLKLLRNYFKIVYNASKLLQNTSNCFKMLQNVWNCFKIHQKMLKRCFKILHNCSKISLKLLQHCFQILQDVFHAGDWTFWTYIESCRMSSHMGHNISNRQRAQNDRNITT